MDFQEFREKIASTQPKKWTPRQKYLDALEKALYGEMYRHIKTPYSREYPDRWSRARISLDERRAAVQYQLPMMIARDLSTRVFGEGGQPTILARYDDATNAWIQALIEDTHLFSVYLDGMWQGAVGSHCVVTRVLAEEAEAEGEEIDASAPGRFCHEVWPAAECQPVFKRTAPNKLLRLTRTYQAKADQLRADGYDTEALETKWRDWKSAKTRSFGMWSSLASTSAQWGKSDEWMLRVVLDPLSETWYEPIPMWIYDAADFKEEEWPQDSFRSFQHRLGETPAIWIRALPTRHKRWPDGESTFEPVIDYQFRIDRTLSQTGRAFDYTGDPQLGYERGNAASGDYGEAEFTAPEATASDLIEIEPGGDAKFIEIQGEGLKIAIESYVKELRNIAREVGAASRIDPEHSPREMSGVAMRMLEHALFGVVGILRSSNVDCGLIPHLRMCMRIAQRVDVELPSLKTKLSATIVKNAAFDPCAAIEAQWPMIPEPSGQEKLAEVQAAMMAASSATGPAAISKETLVANVGPLYDVRDPGKELAAIDSEADADQQNQLDMADSQAAIAAKYSKATDA